jgi:hypothetical protein
LNDLYLRPSTGSAARYSKCSAIRAAQVQEPNHIL